MRWVSFLEIYTFVLKHKSKENNKVVDALSRRALIFMAMKSEINLNRVRTCMIVTEILDRSRRCQEPNVARQ